MLCYVPLRVVVVCYAVLFFVVLCYSLLCVIVIWRIFVVCFCISWLVLVF